MVSGALLSNMAFKPFPGGTRASPVPRQTFCAREEVSCTRYSAEANGPCAKRQTGISSARPTGDGFLSA